jgi:hypothetical protein
MPRAQGLRSCFGSRSTEDKDVDGIEAARSPTRGFEVQSVVAFDLRERLEAANLARAYARRAALQAADEALARLRVYLRLAGRFGWLTDTQYGHASTVVERSDDCSADGTRPPLGPGLRPPRRRDPS